MISLQQTRVQPMSLPIRLIINLMGAVFNESTGAFSWNAAQAGTYSFVVGASDGTTVTAKDVTVVVTNDRHRQQPQ